MDIIKILQHQKNYFKSNITKPFAFRKEHLKKLKKNIKALENEFAEALQKDLGKSEVESFISETGFLYPEIDHTLANLKEWMQEKPVNTPLAHFPTSSYYTYQPKGIVLNISPWNYPVNLSLAPLVAAIAAGNCTVLKPSEFTPYTNEVLKKLVKNTFNSGHVSIIEGEGHIVIPEMMQNFRFDHIFFTGSTSVGKIIAVEAAKQLVPYTLELGGKSPCIIDETANLKVAAKRIVFGKFLNAGQTCVAPDYLIVHKNVFTQLVDYLKKEIENFYGKNPISSKNYGKIINQKQFDRLISYLDEGEILFGKSKEQYQDNSTNLKVFPTLIKPNPNSKLLEDEIFGPILPVLTYQNEEEVFEMIEKSPNPLSLYVFSKNKSFTNWCINNIPFGGGCVNNTIIHLANPNLPFGGVHQSGFGKYHGFEGFKELSNLKSISKTSSSIDIPLRYPPYSNFKEKVIKLFF